MRAERLLEIAIWLAGLVVELKHYDLGSAAMYCEMAEEDVIRALVAGAPAEVEAALEEE